MKASKRKAPEDVAVLSVGDLERLLEKRRLESARGVAAPESFAFEVGSTLAEVERVAITRTLAACSGKKGHACTILGISRPTLDRKLKEYGWKPGGAA